MTDDSGHSGYDIDPELAEFAELMAAQPPITDVREGRALILQYVAPLNAGIDTSVSTSTTGRSPGPPGAPDITVRPTNPEASPRRCPPC